LSTTSALPEIADWGRGFARWTSKALATRQLCETQQSLRVFQSTPAIQEHEDGDRPEPAGSAPEGETDKGDTADKAEDGRYHQTAGAPEHKPEQGPKDLAAIQRINGKNVEAEQAHVNPPHLIHQAIKVGQGVGPSERSAQQDQSR
jgi:hypothetical protein